MYSLQILFGDYGFSNRTNFQEQLDLFHHAKIIIGPHGAGLTNMLWMPDNGSVIEFPLSPAVNRNMGMLAMMCGHDYWMVPELSSEYFGNFEADGESVSAIISVVKHVITQKGLDLKINISGHDEL